MFECMYTNTFVYMYIYIYIGIEETRELFDKLNEYRRKHNLEECYCYI